MKFKSFFVFLILLVVVILVLGCAKPQKPISAPQQEKIPEIPAAPSDEKTNPDEDNNAKDDFGCWPSSCSLITDPQGKQACIDWKAGKAIQWPPDCTSLQPTCVKLCESEKKAGTQSDSPQTTSAPAQKQVFNTLPPLVKADFAGGVSEEDKNLAIRGVSTMDFYLQEWFGKSTDKPSGLQVSATVSDTAGGAQVKTDSGTAIILIETGNSGWKRQIQSNKEIGGEWRPRLVAHEYVHVYQFQNGCGRVDAENPIVPKWFIEGEADWLAYKAAIDAGQLPPLSIPQLVTPQAKQVAGSLESFEKPDELNFPAYFLYTMAIDYLMKDRQINALNDFCANIGDGMSVPKAFETAFGITKEKFYEEFEAYRKTWSSESYPSQGFQN